MIVSGDEAKNFNAVRLDNFQNANRGPLVEADSATGRVLYQDVTGTVVTLTLGEHAIKLLRLYPR